MADAASKPVIDEALLDDLAEKAKAAELLGMHRRLLAVLQDPDHATLRSWVEAVPPLVIAALVEEVRVGHVAALFCARTAATHFLQAMAEETGDDAPTEDDIETEARIMLMRARQQARTALEAGHE